MLLQIPTVELLQTALPHWRTEFVAADVCSASCTVRHLQVLSVQHERVVTLRDTQSIEVSSNNLALPAVLLTEQHSTDCLLSLTPKAARTLVACKWHAACMAGLSSAELI
jgi:hypothetical protein